MAECRHVRELATDMPASHLEFHVEEVSMEAFLDATLPRMLPEGVTFQVFPYQGKHALLKRIGDRLKGYSTWLPPEYRIVLIVDRDNGDCEQLKSTLEEICENAGLLSRRVAGSPDWQIVTRIAIEELEAWYFGDWSAVCAAYPNVSSTVPNQARYRHPDAIRGGTWEAFERVLKQHGYYRSGLAKRQAAAEIGEHLNPMRNQSHSFSVFRDAVAEAAA